MYPDNPRGSDGGNEDSEGLSVYEIGGTASIAGLETEAETAEEAVENMVDELKEKLREGEFVLTEVEANEKDGSGYQLWEQ